MTQKGKNKRTIYILKIWEYYGDTFTSTYDGEIWRKLSFIHPFSQNKSSPSSNPNPIQTTTDSTRQRSDNEKEIIYENLFLLRESTVNIIFRNKQNIHISSKFKIKRKLITCLNTFEYFTTHYPNE